MCNLCVGSVRFVIKRDSRAVFRFGSLQSPAAQRLLAGPSEAESVLLVENGRVYRKSSAVLRIARQLDGAWPALAVLLIVPRPLRDAIYDWIGRRRYRWFGRREACWRPAAELAGRFIDS